MQRASISSFIIGVVTTAALSVAFPAAISVALGQERNPLIGVWKAINIEWIDAETKQTREKLGEGKIAGYIDWTAGGHVLVWLSETNVRRSESKVVGDAERLEWYNAIIAGY